MLFWSAAPSQVQAEKYIELLDHQSAQTNPDILGQSVNVLVADRSRNMIVQCHFIYDGQRDVWSEGSSFCVEIPIDRDVLGKRDHTELHGVLAWTQEQYHYNYLVKLDQWTSDVTACFMCGKVNNAQWTCLTRQANRNPPPQREKPACGKSGPMDGDCF